jgi:DMSO/TMAO reductase YedYZ molybdopterin-dependent catalytic subunit
MRSGGSRYLALCLIIAICLGVGLGHAGEPVAPAADVQLHIGGDVEHPLTLKAADLAKLTRHTVRVQDHDKRESVFEGVALVEALRLAGVPLGKDLRGDRMMAYLVVEAADGYRVVFALPEVDPAYTDRTILLVDRRDQQPLSSHEGPLRLIVPGEKRHARWVRQVTAFTIRRAG